MGTGGGAINKICFGILIDHLIIFIYVRYLFAIFFLPPHQKLFARFRLTANLCPKLEQGVLRDWNHTKNAYLSKSINNAKSYLFSKIRYLFEIWYINLPLIRTIDVPFGNFNFSNLLLLLTAPKIWVFELVFSCFELVPRITPLLN